MKNKQSIKNNSSKNNSNKNNSRPTFLLENDKGKEVRAGGVLFYKLNETNFCYEILMIYGRNNYEDFGGCTDEQDKNILDTICREVEEESNKIFTKEFIREKIKDSKPIYIKLCKYLLYFVELENFYNPEDFGDKEIHDDISRTVEWVKYENFANKDFINKLNFRLKSFNVLAHLKKLFVE